MSLAKSRVRVSKEKPTTTPKKQRDQASPDNSLAVWLRLQRSLAEKNGIALITLSRDGAVIGRIENDNSICQAMRVSPQHAPLCVADCGSAYTNATMAGNRFDFRCHAGLHCFAIPVSMGEKQLVVLGGRVFTSTREYSQFLARYEDLGAVTSGQGLKSIRFTASRDLREAAELVGSTASYHLASFGHSERDKSEVSSASTELLDAHLEIIRLSDKLESRNRAMTQFYEFLHSAASTIDSQKVYQSVLTKFGEIMRSGRSSLMILNEESEELALEAAVGADPEGPIRVKLGEGVAGKVLASALPLVVTDAGTDPRVPHPRPGTYRSSSFVSYPIVLGHRKIGVINLTDRIDGSFYDDEDVAMLEMAAPHLALIIERTEWHRKAETYQRMSLTDPLTGLPNRRYFEDRLYEEVERSKRYATPLSFMIIDVDGFKNYNDVYGHTNADRVLVVTAQMLRNSVRAIDTSARFAGDEFCIVLPETEIQDAAQIAERLRQEVSRTEYRTEQNEKMGRVTISIGISSFSRERQNPLSIIETADRALYQAKTRGRNCVAVYDQEVNSGEAFLS